MIIAVNISFYDTVKNAAVWRKWLVFMPSEWQSSTNEYVQLHKVMQ